MNLMKKNGKRFSALALSAAMILNMVPADNIYAATKKSKAVVSVTVKNVKGKTLVLKKGKTFKLKVKVKTSGKVSKKVKFKSSAPKVVKVSKKGKIKALKNGKAKITITSVANKKKKVTLKIVVGTPVKKVVLDKTILSGKVGDKLKVQATVTPKKASVKKVKFSSSDKKIVTVDNKGNITLIGKGEAKVTATAMDGHGKKAEALVTVVENKSDDSKNNGKTDDKKSDESQLSYKGYELKWEDEFNGKELNRNDWNVELHEPGWVNSEWQEYVDSEENIYVKDGVLHLVPVKKTVGEGENAKTTYTSGRVNTQGKHDFKYGMFEATLKVPTGKGYLPAFWMMPTDENLYGQWPKCGEIDCMEVMGQDTSKLYGTLHYGEPHAEQQNTYVTAAGEKDFAEEFHKFSVEWEPDHITWYVDGVKYHEVTDWFTAAEGSDELTFPAPFDQDFYVILNLAIGGSWVGYPDDKTPFENNDFEIDNVKIYQKDAAYYAEKEANVTKPEKEVIIREPDEEGNYVVNGSFAKDINADTDFELHLEADTSKSTYDIKNNTIKIYPSAEGEVTYAVQLKQPHIPLYHGAEYTLTYDAYAANDRTMIVDIEGPDRNWKRYFNDTTVELTRNKKTYKHKFTMNDKFDANGCLEFNLGAQGSTAPVTISNVKLKITGGEIIDDSKIKEVRPDGNYVYNGKFEEGTGRLKYWEISDEESDAVSVTNVNNVRELKVVAPEGISEENPFIIKQSGLPLTEGKYRLSFDAYKENATEGDTSLEINLDGKSYGGELKSELSTYEYKFEYLEKDGGDGSNKDLYIVITAPGTYYIDNITVNEDAMIKNGSFNAEKSGFNEGFYGESNCAAVVDNQKEDHAYSIDIYDTGAEDWNIQLMQEGITLEKDKWYKFTLKAKSNLERDISVALDGCEDSNWACYNGDSNKIMHLDGQNEWQDYEVVFKMTGETDSTSRLSISMGAVNSTRITDLHRIFIDDISLVETEAVETEDVEAGVNFLVNPTFAGENPMDGWVDTIANWGSDGATAEATKSYDDGTITYDITNVGNEDWHVQLKQNDLSLKAGNTYEVSFKIKSSVDRVIKTGVMSAAYKWYGGSDVTCNANEEQTVTFTFTMDGDDPTAFFYVSMGKIADVDTPAGIIALSDFSIIKK